MPLSWGRWLQVGGHGKPIANVMGMDCSKYWWGLGAVSGAAGLYQVV